MVFLLKCAFAYITVFFLKNIIITITFIKTTITCTHVHEIIILIN
jgi:hypothetical protein